MQNTLFLASLADWWAWALGSIPVVLTLFAAWKKWHNGALARVLKENKALKSDNAKLTREALIRIDDLKDCYAQIDDLQIKVIAQRERAQRLIEHDDTKKP